MICHIGQRTFYNYWLEIALTRFKAEFNFIQHHFRRRFAQLSLPRNRFELRSLVYTYTVKPVSFGSMAKSWQLVYRFQVVLVVHNLWIWVIDEFFWIFFVMQIKIVCSKIWAKNNKKWMNLPLPHDTTPITSMLPVSPS